MPRDQISDVYKRRSISILATCMKMPTYKRWPIGDTNDASMEEEHGNTYDTDDSDAQSVNSVTSDLLDELSELLPLLQSIKTQSTEILSLVQQMASSKETGLVETSSESSKEEITPTKDPEPRSCPAQSRLKAIGRRQAFRPITETTGSG